MSEKKYELRFPVGAVLCHPSSAIAQVTKAQAAAIGEQCAKIKAQKEERVWLFGDFGVGNSHGDIFIYLGGDNLFWMNGAKSELGHPSNLPRSAYYLGNLKDKLKAGPILVGLTEEELLECLDEVHTARLSAKLQSILSDYRESRRQP